MVLVRSLLCAPTSTLTPAARVIFSYSRSRISYQRRCSLTGREEVSPQKLLRALGAGVQRSTFSASSLARKPPRVQEWPSSSQDFAENYKIGKFAASRGDDSALGRRTARSTELRSAGTLAPKQELAISVSVDVEENTSIDNVVQGVVDQLHIDGEAALKLVASELEDAEDTNLVELSLRLCNDAYIQSLNLQWLGKDSPTDVLSFPQDQAPGFIPQLLLGDIIISLDTAARQAEERGHSLLDELRILLVHGLLHLVGYDHELGEEPSQDMEEKEAKVLRELGWSENGLISATQNGDTQTKVKPARISGPSRPIKYLFCDMDGTLLNGKCIVTDASGDAIKAALAKGVQVIIATGKTQQAAVVALDRVGLAGDNGIVSSSKPGVFLQGLEVYGQGGTVIHRANLDSEIVRESFSYSLEKNISTLGFSSNRIVTLFQSELTDILHDFYMEPKAEVIQSINELVASFPIQKMLFYSTPELVKNDIRPYWASKVGEKATLIQAVDNMLEMLPLGQSKARGLKMLLDTFGVSPDEVMALGDGENDIQMLDMVGWGVCMENGCAESKAVAQAVTASNDDEGVAKAIHKYILS